VLFAPHNLLRDPPFSKLDMITCRNLLIYLNRDVQEQILQLFHFVLGPEGFLLLGASESTDGLPSLFTPLDKSQRLFLRRTLPVTALPLPTLPLIGPLQRSPRMVQAIIDGSAHSFSELHTHLLAQYTPPSVIINENYEIIHLSRGAGRFLQFTEGEPSHNLLKVVHPALRIELRTALFAAAQGGSHPEIRRLRAEIDGSARLIDLIVQPIQQPDWAFGYMQVIFNDMAAAGDLAPSSTSTTEPVTQQLEAELQRTKEHLRATIEQYETAAEEYKATNEELQAINEELRATTEELETSKEELQSVNEELTTVNQELKHKVEEVSHSNNDLQNLMASTEIGTIFVNRELLIKRYTPSVQALFNLIPADINRPLAHITHHLNYDQFSTDAARVLATLAKIEHEISSQDGRWYLARLLPYRTLEDKIDGVSLTFVDITDRRLAEEAMRMSEQHLRLLVESIQDYAVLTLDHTHRINSWNPAAEHMLGFSEAEAIGQPIAFTFTPEDRARGEPEHEIQTALAEGHADDNRWHIRKDGSRFYASGVLAPLIDSMGNLRGFVKVMRDLTQQKLAEEQLQQAHDILAGRIEERTRELAGANQRTQVEIAEREHLEIARAELLRRLVTAQEVERRRIARELHDQFGQQLSALRLGLATLADPAQTNRSEAIVRLQHIAAQLDEDVDRLAIELRPAALDDLGLRIALQQHVEEWSARHNISAEFQVTGIEDMSIPPEVEIVIYRVVQEALTNVLKHADAGHVSVILEQRADQVRAIVEDDGRGFDPETLQQTPAPQRQLGLLGMQERVALVSGTITIESALGRGTSVFVHIPTSRTEDSDDKP
jgi:two-component system, chemotaxis family, CheB/CheR fusion protein